MPAIAVLVRSTTDSCRAGSTNQLWPYTPPHRQLPTLYGDPSSDGSCNTDQPNCHLHPGINTLKSLDLAVPRSFTEASESTGAPPLRNTSSSRR